MAYEERAEAAHQRDLQYLQQKEEEYQRETKRLERWVRCGKTVFWLGMIVLVVESVVFRR